MARERNTEPGADLPRADPDPGLRWDGKDFAVIQVAAAHLRSHGRPWAEVDAQGNLTISGTLIPVGSRIWIGKDDISWGDAG